MIEGFFQGVPASLLCPFASTSRREDGMNHESEHIHRILSNREQRRLELAASRTPAARRSPEEVFYSVDNSVKHQAKNRYGNILAYDRTAVLVDGKDYLHANVVVNQTGDQWWVAGQVSSLFLVSLGTGAHANHRLPPRLPFRSSSGLSTRGRLRLNARCPQLSSRNQGRHRRSLFS